MVFTEQYSERKDGGAAAERMVTPDDYPALLHFHIYQPPRILRLESDIGPVDIFNISGMDRIPGGYNRAITDASYRNLVEYGILSDPLVSWNVYGVTADWMNEHEPDLLYNMQHRPDTAIKPVGDPYLHVIFPFLSDLHKRTLFRMGNMVYKEHWGTSPDVIWLPESAVDTPTLRALAAEGINGVLLRNHQIRAEIPASTYQIVTESGAITIFTNDGDLGRMMAYDHPWADSYADRWSETANTRGHTVRVAVDGETIGWHWKEADGAFKFTEWLISYLKSGHNGNTIPIQASGEMPLATLVEESSWSCLDAGVGRWQGADGCSCDLPGDHTAAARVRASKRDLYTKMQQASVRIESELDSLYNGAGDGTGLPLGRVAYMNWFISQRSQLARGEPLSFSSLPEEQRNVFRLTVLRDIGSTSCGWFFGDTEGYERQIPANCLRTIADISGWDDVRPL